MYDPYPRDELVYTCTFWETFALQVDSRPTLKARQELPHRRGSVALPGRADVSKGAQAEPYSLALEHTSVYGNNARGLGAPDYSPAPRAVCLGVLALVWQPLPLPRIFYCRSS